MKISGFLRQHEIFQVSCIERFYSVGKTRGPKQGPIHSGRYELPFPDDKETCKGQNKKSRQHKLYKMFLSFGRARCLALLFNSRTRIFKSSSFYNHIVVQNQVIYLIVMGLLLFRPIIRISPRKIPIIPMDCAVDRFPKQVSLSARKCSTKIRPASQ